MSDYQRKIEQMKSIISLLEANVSRKEVMDAFQNLLQMVGDLKSANAKEFSLIKSSVSMLGDKLANDSTATLDNLRQRVSDLEAEVRAAIAAIPEVRDGKDAPQLPEILAAVQPLIPPPLKGDKGDPGDILNIAALGTATRDGLELITDEPEKLKISAIGYLQSKLDDLASRIQRAATTRTGSVARGFMLYINGVKKLLTANTINFVPGTGITVSYSYAQGRNDVTISATGSASLTPITVTGTIDDSNTSFTAASAPNLVVVNGTAYRNGHGVTISGTSITLDDPVGSGGDIYAL